MKSICRNHSEQCLSSSSVVKTLLRITCHRRSTLPCHRLVVNASCFFFPQTPTSPRQRMTVSPLTAAEPFYMLLGSSSVAFSSQKPSKTGSSVSGKCGHGTSVSPLDGNSEDLCDFISSVGKQREETKEKGKSLGHSHSCSHWQNFSQKFWVITQGHELSQGWSGWSHGW